MKDQFFGMNLKQKVRIEYTTNEYRYFLESNFVEINRFALDYSNQDDISKRFKTQRYFSPKRNIDNHNNIINGKNFYDQPIDSDIKRYEVIRKLTTRCLLDYDYIKSISFK